jgi:hypothetical protein
MPPSVLNDLINTRFLTPYLTTQAFLPLLTSPAQLHSHAPPKPSILVLTPSIISHLSPAFHSVESALVPALTGFAAVLKSELAPLSIPVKHLQLGTFDFSAFTPHHLKQTQQSQRAETLTWDDQARASYGRNFVALSNGIVKGKGSSLRELNNAVFDAMMSGKSGVTRVGMGASVYGFVGRWVPTSLVQWMMGMREVVPQDGMPRLFKGLIGNGENSSSGSETGENSDHSGLGESDYVYPEGGEWREDK